MANTKPRILTEVRLARLRPHPRQAVFGDLGEFELRQLSDDMASNGMVYPVEILPNGTIICGHQRIGAAKLLGWECVTCWVRHDLAEQGEEAIERRLIQDNLNRRQLSRLEKARAYLRLRETYVGRRGDGDVRDQLAGLFGVSGRTLDRLEKVLETPLEVQQACDDRRLSIAMAGKVANLPQELQETIAVRIRDGQSPEEVVADFLPAPRQRSASARTAVRRFARAMEQGVEELPEWEDDIFGVSPCYFKEETLIAAKDLIERLLPHVQRWNREHPRRTVEQVIESIKSKLSGRTD